MRTRPTHTGLTPFAVQSCTKRRLHPGLCSSEFEPQGKLDFAWRARTYGGHRRYLGVYRTRDVGEDGSAADGSRRGKVVAHSVRLAQLRVIEDIVELGTELEPPPFPQRKRLIGAEVDLPGSGTWGLVAQRAAETCGAVRARISECRRIDPLSDAPAARRGERDAGNQIGTLRAGRSVGRDVA
jgi:hypothetical protein